MLLAIESVFSVEEALEMRQQLAQSQWVDGKLSAGSQAATVKTNQHLDDRTELAQSIGSRILAVLNAHPQFISAALPNKIMPAKFNRYTEGGQYGAHVDSSIMSLPGGMGQMRTDLSATLFLSRADDYDGGELLVETQFGTQEVKLEAGDLVLYPSTSLHQVNPVLKGARICSVFWIQSLVRDNQQREILYELDQSVQTLTLERGQGDSEVSRLTGIYHNLMRCWATT
ncbi:Fe2+-dependent dioxygenase [Granulosicoccus antarcticus]|uniref:PKHD-type hydroxylase n=1 Tax=Granulosicoccus antarcticus IMCC3135 TaxID=1192854 RepID=A0A2Z2P1Q9_9GAMM|nr:Fe2+-dependent dioxygenase [Granulosicoccus antarcticus]ASJ75210.1 PKHD-type hydroxylase [Granulosicoccus antarcticus IMCC3135]